MEKCVVMIHHTEPKAENPGLARAGTPDHVLDIRIEVIGGIDAAAIGRRVEEEVRRI